MHRSRVQQKDELGELVMGGNGCVIHIGSESRPIGEKRKGKGGVLCTAMGWGGGEGSQISGPKFDLKFELAVLDELGGPGRCEVHVFDHRAALEPGLLPSQLPHGLIVHPWSIEGDHDRLKGRRTHLTLSETLEKLGHKGRTIDLFKVDCESCEWTQYADWLNVDADLKQILVELHGTPRLATNIFEMLRVAGYVIFHKEVDVQYGGMWVEYGFLKLHQDFFDK